MIYLLASSKFEGIILLVIGIISIVFGCLKTPLSFWWSIFDNYNKPGHLTIRVTNVLLGILLIIIGYSRI